MLAHGWDGERMEKEKRHSDGFALVFAGTEISASGLLFDVARLEALEDWGNLDMAINDGFEARAESPENQRISERGLS